MGEGAVFNSDYWDESEFNFFEKLEDEDKLLYLYDLMIGEFAYMELHLELNELDEEMAELDEFLKSAEEEELDDPIRQDVVVSFESDGKIMFRGSELDVLVKVSNDMIMNGLILSNKNIEFTKFEPWHVVLSYDLIGEGSPISLN